MSCLTPVYTNCITFTAGLTARLKALGYEATTFEDLLIEMIQKEGASAAAKITALEAAVQDISTETLPANVRMFGLSTGSVDAAGLPERTLTYKQAGNQFTFDLTAVKNALPAGYSFLGANVTLVGADGKRAVSKGTLGTMQAPQLPAQAVVAANIQTANGLITLEKNLYISGDVESTATLTAKDLNTAPADLTLKQAVEVLSAEVVALKQR